MAKYDPRILVPYLRDVYSMELLRNDTLRNAQKVQDNIRSYRYRLDQDRPPAEPQRESFWWTVAFGCGALLATGASVFFFWNDDMAIMFLLGIAAAVGSLFLWCMTIGLCASYFRNIEELDKYRADMRKYNSRAEARAALQSESNYWRDMENVWNEKLKAVEKLRSDVYSVNVIPSKYRNIYAAHYLYQYFSTSNADDLDMILQTFILEEIKDRLDDIIDQQTEMILNQRTMIAKQEAANEAIARNHKRHMLQLANLNENAQRQNSYLEMINANLAVSNYFAYKQYLKQ